MGKTLLFNGEENCHPVVFRLVPETNHLVALLLFEEEIMLDNLCLVITSSGQEYIEDRKRMLDSTKIAYTEQIDMGLIERIEKEKGWDLYVLNYPESLASPLMSDEV
ncbi:MAG: hypothetical protein IKO75_00185 [Bacteroidales bacterium]|nr:hypothetical protein [Bacteroidales bacterium]